MNVARKVVDNERPSAADRMAAMCPPRAKPRPRGVSAGQVAAWSREAEAMMASGDWSGASPKHFLCAFEMLFRRVYGFAPTMAPSDRLRALQTASTALRAHHGGDPGSMADYVHWVWAREQAREQWRRSQGRSGGTVTWYVMFGSSAMVDEWRADSLRHRGPRAR